MTKAFKRLALSQLMADLADTALTVLIIANIYQLSDSLLASSVIPVLMGSSSFLTTFLAPLISKKVPLNQIMIVTQAGKTFVLGLLTLSLVFYPKLPVILIYLLVLVISLLDGIERPVTVTLMAHYTPDLTRANSILTVCDETVALLGWGFGGILYTSLGIHWGLLVTLIIFVLATSVTCLLPHVEFTGFETENNWQLLFKGWQLLLKRPQLKLLVTLNLIETFANTIWVSSIILVFVTKVLHENQAYWGYANMTYSFGIILGGLIVYRRADALVTRKVFSIISALLLTALFNIVILKIPVSSVFLICSTLIGIVSQLKEVPEAVLYQESVAKELLVDISSVFEVISTLSFAGLLFLMSWTTEKFGIDISFGLASLSLLAEASLVFKYRKYLT